MPLPRLLAEPTLPAAELSAARIDGEVYAVGAGWCPLDVTAGPAERAAGALSGRPASWIAELETALWIWGGVDDEPGVLRVCVPMASRGRQRSGAGDGAVLREVVIDDRDVVRMGGAAVTSALRTIVDLARQVDDWSAVEPGVRRLCDAGLVAPDALASALPGDGHLAHARRARGRLVALAADQPLLTR